jgi:hypothetical protein
MQGQIFDQCKIRRSMWDGPMGLSYGMLNVSGAYSLPNGAPYLIALNNGATAINVTMYNPTLAGSPTAPNIMWCHELWNQGNTTGTITIKGVGGGTVGTLAPGKRAEVVWNAGGASPEWVVFVSA